MSQAAVFHQQNRRQDIGRLFLNEMAQRIDDVRKRVALRHHLEDSIFGGEQSLRPFAILHIDSSSVPVQDLALFIPQWHSANKEPPVVSVRITMAGFMFERLATGTSLAPSCHMLCAIIGMNAVCPTSARALLRRDP